jgi:hypothetical protein
MMRATAILVFAAAVTAADQALAHGGEAYVPPDLAGASRSPYLFCSLALPTSVDCVAPGVGPVPAAA